MNSFAQTAEQPMVRRTPYVRKGIGETISLRSIYATFYRRRFLLIGVFLTVFLLGALYTFLTPKKYTATASIQLEQQTPQVLPNKDLDPGSDVEDAARFLQTQLDRVRSRTTVERVADQLRIADRPELLAALDVDREKSVNQKEEIVAALQDGLSAQLGLNTRLALISFVSRDARVSANVANTFAEVMASTNIEAKSQVADKAGRYLLTQLEDARVRLESSEQAMLGYARAAGLSTTVVNGASGDQGGSLDAQRLRVMTDALARATAQRIDAEQQWRQAQRSTPMALAQVQENRAVQDMLSQRGQAQAALSEEQQRHTANYPAIGGGAAKVRVYDQQISRIAGDVRRSYQDRYRTAVQQEQQLSREVSRLRSSAMSERERAVGYNTLQREVDTNRAFYDGLLQRYKEVGAASGAPSANVTVVDRAEPPLDPSEPNVPRNLALSAMAGLILALGTGLVRERMDQVVRSPDDLATRVNAPSLGVIPKLAPGQSIRDALTDPASPQSEAYHSVAASLPNLMGSVPKRILMTSSAAGEGKSTSAIALSSSLATMGRRVLLIEGDLRRPSLGTTLSLASGPGFSDVLRGKTEAQAVIQKSNGYGFDVIAAGTGGEPSIRLLSTEEIESTLAQLSDRYDVVVIDGPPVLGLADAVMLAHRVDVAVIVVEANRLLVEQVELAASRLPASIPAGTIITKFDPKKAGALYGDNKYYTY